MEIVNYRESSKDDKIKAIFDVYLGNNSTITYPNFRLKYGKNGGYYVARPSYLKSEDTNGNKTFGSYPEMSGEKWKSLSDKVTELLKPFLVQSCSPAAINQPPLEDNLPF